MFSFFDDLKLKGSVLLESPGRTQMAGFNGLNKGLAALIAEDYYISFMTLLALSTNRAVHCFPEGSILIALICICISLGELIGRGCGAA